MSGIGHNNGPALEAGRSFRRHAWTRARAELIPNLPIEILRRRVARAKELGLPYKTYASVRASTGRDVVGFLFSTNALRMLRRAQLPPEDRMRHVRAVEKTSLTALAQPPLDPEATRRILNAQGLSLAAIDAAPRFDAAWSELRRAVRSPLVEAGLPADGVLCIGDTSSERDWSEAAKLAGFLTSERYFDAPGRI